MRLHLLMIAILLTGLFVNCGGDEAQAPEPPKSHARYVVGMKVHVGETSVAPDWVDDEGGIINLDGQKYVWVKGEGDSKESKIAKRTAIGDAQARMAESISVVVASQFAQAWDALGLNDKENIEMVKQGLIATKSLVNVRGFRLIKKHKEQVAIVKTLKPDGEPGQLGSPMIRYTVMMAMPYAEYIRVRDNTVERMKKEAKPNDRQKVLIEKAEKKLEEIDSNPPELKVPDKTPLPRV